MALFLLLAAQQKGWAVAIEFRFLPLCLATQVMAYQTQQRHQYDHYSLTALYLSHDSEIAQLSAMALSVFANVRFINH
ncbi:hypothetical protein ACOV1V_17960 [Leclercia pneumoniae]|uniref:hypothetical protein n=1 Tax=Leclercia pneumoniae TaxID=2815358 RepID=UPI003BF4E74D